MCQEDFASWVVPLPQLVDKNYLGWWIGKRDPTEWFAEFLDLSPVDFFHGDGWNQVYVANYCRWYNYCSFKRSLLQHYICYWCPVETFSWNELFCFTPQLNTYLDWLAANLKDVSDKVFRRLFLFEIFNIWVFEGFKCLRRYGLKRRNV